MDPSRDGIGHSPTCRNPSPVPQVPVLEALVSVVGDLSGAVATGERLTTLRVLAARLAADLDASNDARVVAPLSMRLMDVLAQIDELGGGVKAPRKATGLDEFTGRLAARKSAPAARRSRVG